MEKYTAVVAIAIKRIQWGRNKGFETTTNHLHVDYIHPHHTPLHLIKWLTGMTGTKTMPQPQVAI